MIPNTFARSPRSPPCSTHTHRSPPSPAPHTHTHTQTLHTQPLKRYKVEIAQLKKKLKIVMTTEEEDLVNKIFNKAGGTAKRKEPLKDGIPHRPVGGRNGGASMALYNSVAKGDLAGVLTELADAQRRPFVNASYPLPANDFLLVAAGYPIVGLVLLPLWFVFMWPKRSLSRVAICLAAFVLGLYIIEEQWLYWPFALFPVMVCPILLPLAVSNASTRTHQTVLTLACAEGYFDIVRVLLDSGADPNQEIGGKKALAVAMMNGHRRIARLLIARGATRNSLACGCTAAVRGLLCCHVPVSFGCYDATIMLRTIFVLLIVPLIASLALWSEQGCYPGTYTDLSACAPGYVPAPGASPNWCYRIPNLSDRAIDVGASISERQNYASALAMCESDDQYGDAKYGTSLVTFDSNADLDG